MCVLECSDTAEGTRLKSVQLDAARSSTPEHQLIILLFILILIRYSWWVAQKNGWNYVSITMILAERNGSGSS